jgi:hypothetical protein
VVEVEAASITELIDWRNSNVIVFVRKEDGSIWVTPEQESKVTPSIAAAIRANQQTLAAFVIGEVVDSDNAVETADEKDQIDEAFSMELDSVSDEDFKKTLSPGMAKLYDELQTST